MDSAGQEFRLSRARLAFLLHTDRGLSGKVPRPGGWNLSLTSLVVDVSFWLRASSSSVGLST